MPENHANYPHEAGTLYDCKACERECYCIPDAFTCVGCALMQEAERKNND